MNGAEVGHACPCDTCGGTGVWQSTLEDAPTTLVNLGPCPDCQQGDEA